MKNKTLGLIAMILASAMLGGGCGPSYKSLKTTVRFYPENEKTNPAKAETAIRVDIIGLNLTLPENPASSPNPNAKFVTMSNREYFEQRAGLQIKDWDQEKAAQFAREVPPPLVRKTFSGSTYQSVVLSRSDKVWDYWTENLKATDILIFVDFGDEAMKKQAPARVSLDSDLYDTLDLTVDVTDKSIQCTTNMKN